MRQSDDAPPYAIEMSRNFSKITDCLTAQTESGLLSTQELLSNPISFSLLQGWLMHPKQYVINHANTAIKFHLTCILKSCGNLPRSSRVVRNNLLKSGSELIKSTIIQMLSKSDECETPYLAIISNGNPPAK